MDIAQETPRWADLEITLAIIAMGRFSNQANASDTPASRFDWLTSRGNILSLPGQIHF